MLVSRDIACRRCRRDMHEGSASYITLPRPASSNSIQHHLSNEDSQVLTQIRNSRYTLYPMVYVLTDS